MYTLLLRLHLSSKQHNTNMTLLLPIMQDMQQYNGNIVTGNWWRATNSIILYYYY